MQTILHIRDSSLIRRVQIGFGVQTASYSMRNVSPTGRKRETEHSFPFRAEVKNGWGYTSTPPPPLCRHGTHRNSLNFALCQH